MEEELNEQLKEAKENIEEAIELLENQEDNLDVLEAWLNTSRAFQSISEIKKQLKSKAGNNIPE